MYLTTKTWNQAASYRFVGNLALAPMADRPLTLRRLLASHRDHRANLLGGVCRRRARARRIGEPLGCARRQRPRQYRPVFGHTPSSRALSRTPISSTACNIMRLARPTVVG